MNQKKIEVSFINEKVKLIREDAIFNWMQMNMRLLATGHVLENGQNQTCSILNCIYSD